MATTPYIQGMGLACMGHEIRLCHAACVHIPRLYPSMGRSKHAVRLHDLVLAEIGAKHQCPAVQCIPVCVAVSKEDCFQTYGGATWSGKQPSCCPTHLSSFTNSTTVWRMLARSSSRAPQRGNVSCIIKPTVLITAHIFVVLSVIVLCSMAQYAFRSVRTRINFLPV